MLKTLTKISLGLALASMMSFGQQAIAAGGKTAELQHNHWSFQGVTGKYDKDAVQRGFQVYREVCASCHSIDLVSFRNLGQKGGPYYLAECPKEFGLPASTDCSNPNDNPIVKQIASEYTITDGPDDAGDMFERPGIPADRIPGPYANAAQARAANGGAMPPDFSLIAKARKYGPDYIYSLLLGYDDPPETIEVGAGTYYNKYYPGDASSLLKPEYLDEEGHVKEGVKIPYGGAFKMANPLPTEGMIDYYDPQTPETIEQYAADVSHFLMWAAEPKLEQRKTMGVIVVSYLIILALILYFSMKQLWARVK